MIILSLLIFCLFGSDPVIGRRFAAYSSNRRPAVIVNGPAPSRLINNAVVGPKNIKNQIDFLRCGGDRNAIYTTCPEPCPRTCQFPGGTGFCSKMCLNEGCQCKEGFFLNDVGKCVALQDCPGAKSCTANENFVFCNVGCPTNFCPEDNSLAIVACSSPFPCESGCSCKPNFLRLGRGDDRCVPAAECPPPLCGANEEITCKSTCPPKICESLITKFNCSRIDICESGCDCIDGFLRNENGVCVPSSECFSAPPIECGLNEIPSDCSVICPPQMCDSIFTTFNCSGNDICESGCDCSEGFLRNETGFCVPSEDCFLEPPLCGVNEETTCKSTCPPKICESLITKFNCSRTDICESGCDCIDGFLRNGNGICVPSSECFSAPPIECGLNEIPSDCSVICPPQTCDSIFTTFNCSGNDICESGCDCLEGFLRNETGFCVPSEDCFLEAPLCGVNEETTCKSTCPPKICESLITKFNCSRTDICESGCDCIDGFLRNGNGICIPGSECFSAPIIECGLNEIPSDCSVICPPQTCDSIFTTFNCSGNDICESGCDCLEGFLRNETGFCVPSEDCFLAPPLCGVNEETTCKSTCPPKICESLITKFNCSRTDICESGCDCIDGFLRNGNGICVPSSECFSAPPMECGLNEIPSDCSVICPPQTCDSIFTTFNCSGNDICESGCDCLEGFLRNETGFCVLSEDCFLGPQCNIAPECRATCAVPNPQGCDFNPTSEINQDGCSCEEGFILSEVDGTCIEIENCPTNIGCNGDPKAIVKQCPQPRPCQSTCASPNAFPCETNCEAVGCECLPGYILNKFGRCMLPDNCKGGNPCGPDGTFVACRSLCQNSFCPENDDRIFPICETFPSPPCLSGCTCNLNHRFISRDDQRCIRSDTCPPMNCTRQHERWTSCPVDCNSGFCEEVDRPLVTCDIVLLSNCNPQCTCDDGFFRDPSTDLCVSSEECRIINLKN